MEIIFPCDVDFAFLSAFGMRNKVAVLSFQHARSVLGTLGYNKVLC